MWNMYQQASVWQYILCLEDCYSEGYKHKIVSINTVTIVYFWLQSKTQDKYMLFHTACYKKEWSKYKNVVSRYLWFYWKTRNP